MDGVRADKYKFSKMKDCRAATPFNSSTAMEIVEIMFLEKEKVAGAAHWPPKSGEVRWLFRGVGPSMKAEVALNGSNGQVPTQCGPHRIQVDLSYFRI
ncbi:hypothetical protein AAC387_Pa11g2193 [Persea americana]